MEEACRLYNDPLDRIWYLFLKVSSGGKILDFSWMKSKSSFYCDPARDRTPNISVVHQALLLQMPPPSSNQTLFKALFQMTHKHVSHTFHVANSSTSYIKHSSKGNWKCALSMTGLIKHMLSSQSLLTWYHICSSLLEIKLPNPDSTLCYHIILPCRKTILEKQFSYKIKTWLDDTIF